MVSGSELYGQESEEQDRNVNVLCHIMIAEDQKVVQLCHPFHSDLCPC